MSKVALIYTLTAKGKDFLVKFLNNVSFSEAQQMAIHKLKLSGLSLILPRLDCFSSPFIYPVFAGPCLPRKESCKRKHTHCMLSKWKAMH